MDNEHTELDQLIFFNTLQSECSDNYVVLKKYSSLDSVATCLSNTNVKALKRGGGAVRVVESREDMDDITLQKSVQRSRRTIKDRCKSMGADRLLTLTTRADITNLDEFWALFDSFRRLLKKRLKRSNNSFSYVAVPELHKNGSYHFHLAISGFYDVYLLRSCWRFVLKKRGYTFYNEKKCVIQGDGNVDITDPKRYKRSRKASTPSSIASYIAKYLSKDLAVLFNKKRFASSRGIPKPIVHRAFLERGAPLVYALTTAIRAFSHAPVQTVSEFDAFVYITQVST